MDELVIGGRRIAPGEQVSLDLPLAQLYTHSPLTMPVRVLRGRKPGPTLFVSAALHGDELNGVEIIRRLLRLPALKRLRGTLLAVPVVNVHGFINRSRYLPDRRDLNRSFPGLESGSLAARIAHCFIDEIVSRADYGIDLHTGAVHRGNLPQIRANLDTPGTRELALAFDAPLLLDSKPAPGTLREYTSENNIPVLLYESGEALRFDESCIQVGLRGVVNVMRALAMLPPSRRKTAPTPAIAHGSLWVRAPSSGVLRTVMALGEQVRAGQVLGYIADTFGEAEQKITAPQGGLIIGKLNLPLVFEGEAVFHIAQTRHAGDVAEQWEELQAQDEPVEPMSDEPVIV